MERTKYCQELMNRTYHGIAVEAIKNGFKGSWERLIAAKIHKDYVNDHSEAIEIIDSVCWYPIPIKEATIKAAKLILSSTIPESHEQH